MKCPNCSAECSDQSLECDFCGHPFIDGFEQPAAPAPKAASTPPPLPQGNPYAAAYPSSSQPSQPSLQLPRESYPAGSVPNYLVWAILATLCCCLPGGIVAIVYAAQVDGKLAAGDYQGALNASNNAKLWSWVSFGLGAVVSVLYFLAIVMGGVADAGGY